MEQAGQFFHFDPITNELNWENPFTATARGFSQLGDTIKSWFGMNTSSDSSSSMPQISESLDI